MSERYTVQHKPSLTVCRYPLYDKIPGDKVPGDKCQKKIPLPNLL